MARLELKSDVFVLPAKTMDGDVCPVGSDDGDGPVENDKESAESKKAYAKIIPKYPVPEQIAEHSLTHCRCRRLVRMVCQVWGGGRAHAQGPRWHGSVGRSGPFPLPQASSPR